MDATNSDELHVVTGAFGFSGKYIARRLLDAGCRVRTLTNSPQRKNPFGDAVEVHPLNFDDAAQLTESLAGAKVLYNTYWVRFNYGTFEHATAVENTIKLFRAAKNAGVGRVVHVSITNPSIDSPLEYFFGKARLERTLIDSGLPYTILRPAVLFGQEDILINNIAWAVRKFPGVFHFRQRRIPLAADFRRRFRQAGRRTRRKDREFHHQRHRAGDVHLSQLGADDRPGHRQRTSADRACRRSSDY